MRHYGSGMHQFSYDDIRNVCVIRIDIDSMTEKSMTVGYRFFGINRGCVFLQAGRFYPRSSVRSERLPHRLVHLPYGTRSP